MLTAIYDLACSPPTFDFVGFLVSAERARIAAGEDRIALLVVPGPEGGFRRDRLPPREPAARRRMLERIVLPMARLLPSMASVAEVPREAAEARAAALAGPVFPADWRAAAPVAHYGQQWIVQAARAGCVPLRAPTGCPRPDSEIPPGTVTITLREAPYWPQRNSNRAEWLRVAEGLAARGLVPLFLPDTASAPLPPPWRAERAVLDDLGLRARLYAGARLNLFVNNGPAALALFLAGAASIVCKMVSDAPATTAAFFRACGLAPGSQYGRPDYRILWQEDEAPAILATIDGLLAAAA